MTGPSLWLRRARRDRSAALTTVVVLALGIAVNVVVFQCVERLVLNPLPLPDADRIVVVGSEMPAINRPLRYFEPFSGPELTRLTENTRTLEAMVPFDLNSVRLQGTDLPARLFGAFVWGDPLPLLGVNVELGRGFSEEEIRTGAKVAILSHSAWTRDFGGDPGVVGIAAIMDGEAYTVVGVLPPYAAFYGVDVWMPSSDRLENLAQDRRQFNLMGRLRSTETLESANADLASQAAVAEQAWAGLSDNYVRWRVQAASFARNSASSYSDEAVFTMLAALIVLCLISVNLGNLSLVRGTRDRPEVATRLALGSGRVRIAMDAAGEACLLGLAGGLLGTLTSAGAFVILNQTLPGVLRPSGPPLALSGEGILYAAGVTLASTALLAAAAVVARAGTAPSDVMAASRGGAASRRLRVAQRGLVALQLALGLALATGAGTVGLSVARVLLEPPGFAVDELVSMRLSLPADTYTGDGVSLFFESLVTGVEALPGALAGSVATQVAPNTNFSAEVALGQAGPGSDSTHRLYHTVIGDGYFSTMGITLVEGRGLDARDVPGGSPAMVINEAARRQLFPEGAPVLGERIRVRGTRFDSGWGQIVGVSADVRNRGQGEPPAPEVFTAHRQAGDRYRQLFLVARARQDPGNLVPSIRTQVQRLDPAQPVYSIGTPRSYLNQQVAPRRVAAYLLLALAVAAVALAAIGLHGTMAYAVAMRRSEFALRAAVGASPTQLRGLLLREATGTVAAGLVLGGILTAWLGWLLRAYLGAGVSETLPVSGVAALVLVLTAYSALLRPARQAVRTDPAQALRNGG